MLISATNFVTMIFLARGLSPTDFGGFTLVYSVLLFANSLQSGLITQPHNILGATRDGADYARYTTTTAVGQLILVAALALPTLAGWGVALAVGWDAAPLLAALAVSIVAWQLQEFARRVLYTEGRLAAAFANDLISYGGQALAILALEQLALLTGARALAALAVTSALGAILGGWQLRGGLAGPIDRTVLRENWHFGKWMAGTEIVGSWLSSQLLVYLVAAMLGAAAAGVLRAVHTVFGPMRVLAYAFNTVLPIRFARTLAAEGKAALRGQLRSAFLVAVPTLGGYCLLAILFAGPLLRLLYGDRYVGQAAVLALYAVSMFISYVAMIIAAALQALRLSRPVFTSRLYASLVTIPIGCLLILVLGIPGAVLGTILSSLVLCSLSWLAYHRGLDGAPDS
jgi:O-antigen/teichoic acid export membrane protein